MHQNTTDIAKIETAYIPQKQSLTRLQEDIASHSLVSFTIPGTTTL